MGDLMRNKKLLLPILLSIVMLAVGFVLGVLWAGNLYKNLKRVARTPESPQMQAAGTVGTEGLPEKQLLEQIRKNPKDDQALASLGDLYFDSKQYVKAVEYYEKALKINSADGDTYNDLGLAQFYLGRDDEAITTLKNGIRAAPNYQRIYLTCGFVLTSIHDNKEAEKVLKHAVEMDPNSTIAKEAKGFLRKLR